MAKASEPSGRALIIEDDVLIAMDLEDMLRQIGFAGIEMARDLAEADRVPPGPGLTVVIADLQLEHERATPALHRYASSGVPLVVATGAMDAREVVKSLPRCALLEKPYTRQNVESALRQLDLI